MTVRLPYDEETGLIAVISGPGFARLDEAVPGYTTIGQLVLLFKIVSFQVLWGKPSCRPLVPSESKNE
jgi:hypothetical protein